MALTSIYFFQLNIFCPSRSVHMAPTTVHRFAIQFVLIIFPIIRKSFSSILTVELWVVLRNFSTSLLHSLGVSQACRRLEKKLSDKSLSDLFVIVVSIGLASKFKQINEDLMEVKGRSVHPAFWSEYRLYYREITSLISLVDNAMSKIILISISNNLFFICVQLLRSFEWVGSIRWSTICDIFLFQWKAFVRSLFLLLGIAGVLDRENACCFTLLRQYKRWIEETSRSFSIRFTTRLVSRSEAI